MSDPSSGTAAPPESRQPEPPESSRVSETTAERRNSGASGTLRIRLLPALCLAAVLAAIAGLFHWFGSEGLDNYGGGASVFRWLFIQYHFPDMQFTWIMPLVALYAVWDERRTLAEEAERPDDRGVLAVAAMLAGHILAFRAGQPRLSLFAMAISAWASCWALFGRRVAYRLLFPLGYVLLSFLAYHITNYTTALQVLASRLSAFFLRGFGLQATNTGSVIKVALANGAQAPLVFNVADGCSGLRSLVVLSALAAPYAYFRIRGNVRAWLLFAASVPLAIFTNILRIASLTLFAHIFGTDLALQVYHDPAGFLVFFIAILLLQATGTFLERDWRSIWHRFRARIRRRGAPAPADISETPETPAVPSPGTPCAADTSAPPIPPSPWSRAATAAVILALVGATAYAVSRPRHFTGNPDAPVTFDFPAELGPYTVDHVLFCTNDQCFREYRRSEFGDNEDAASLVCPVCGSPLDTMSIGERRILPKGTPLIHRVYTATGRPDIHVSAVFAGRDRSAIHRPQHCLYGQGYTIIDDHLHTVDLPDGRHRTFDILDTVRHHKDDTGRTVSYGMLYAYWYFNPERETASNLLRILWTGSDSVLRNYRPRWAYVTISLACNPDKRAPAYELFEEMARLLDPYVTAYQADMKRRETEDDAPPPQDGPDAPAVPPSESANPR